MSELTAKEKAQQLVNMCYNHVGSQLQAIEMAERAVLGTICERIDSLDSHIFFRKDFDEPLLKSAIKELKSWQEVAAELQNIKTAMAV